MPVILQAITPKRQFLPDPAKLKQQLKQNMKLYTAIVLDEMLVYPPPPPKPARVRVTKAMRQAAALKLEEFKEPAANKWRRYRRTFNLRKGWQAVVTADGSQGFVFNNVKYAVFVQGPRGGTRGVGQRQRAYHHRLGWRSITDVSRETKKQFETLMNRAVKGSIK